MNAPAQVTEADPIADLEDFRECCEQQARFHHQGLVSLHTAVDNLQHLAERWDLIDLHGQDEIQAEMAAAFASVDLVDDSPLTDYAADVLRRWELADPRDRWKHTGEPPPAPEPETPAKRLYRTPQATVDAFLYVATLDDPERLKRWLSDHKRDAAFLLTIWMARQC